MSEKSIEPGDVVRVNFNSGQCSLSQHEDFTVLHLPQATGDSWRFGGNVSGDLHYVSEGCTVTKLGAKEVKPTPESLGQSCEDEGCPHHGEPHSHPPEPLQGPFTFTRAGGNRKEVVLARDACSRPQYRLVGEGHGVAGEDVLYMAGPSVQELVAYFESRPELRDRFALTVKGLQP